MVEGRRKRRRKRGMRGKNSEKRGEQTGQDKTGLRLGLKCEVGLLAGFNRKQLGVGTLSHASWLNADWLLFQELPRH